MSEELRTERRISGEALPEDLRELNFSTGFFHEQRAELSNISRNGISFYVYESKSNYEIGQKLKVNFFSRKIKLSGKIVYINRITEDKIKIGLNLSHSLGLDKINEILDSVDSN